MHISQYCLTTAIGAKWHIGKNIFCLKISPSNVTYSAKSVSPNEREVLYLDSTEAAYCIGQMHKAVSQATLANYR